MNIIQSHTIDFDNLNPKILSNVFNSIRNKRHLFENIKDEIYQIDILSDYKSVGISRTIIPNRLEYEPTTFTINRPLKININSEKIKYYDILDYFIFDWIEENNIQNIKILINQSFNMNYYSEIENGLVLFDKLYNFCLKKNQTLLGIIGLIFDFYKDDDIGFFKIKKSHIRFLKKIKMHNYNFDNILHLFFKSCNDNHVNKNIFLYMNNNYLCKAFGNIFFKTRQTKLYSSHRSLNFINFLNDF